MIPLTPTLTLTEVLIILLALFGIVAHIWGWQEALRDEGAVLARQRNTPGARLLLDIARAHAREEGIRLVVKVVALGYGLNAAGASQGAAAVWGQTTILTILVLLTVETWTERKMRHMAIRDDARLPDRIAETAGDVDG